MSEQFIFAVRVCGACTAFLIAAFLAREIGERVKYRQIHDLAFLLVLSSAGLAFGTFMNLTWGVLYHFRAITHHPVEWMVTSSFIPVYTSLMLISALTLMRALAISKTKAFLSFAFVIGAGIAAYIGIGYYI